MDRLFTDRQGEGRPRVQDVLGTRCRDGLVALVWSRMQEEWLGASFPALCGAGLGNAGTDLSKLEARLKALGIIWPADYAEFLEPPPDGQVFDLVEFTYEYIAEPTWLSSDSYWGHSHYKYDQAAGRTRFATEVNHLFERNGMAFELRDGRIERLIPLELQETLAATVFRSGDNVLDDLLVTSRRKFLHRDVAVRREALEKLWDAWERLKTLEHGKDKKAKTIALLRKAAPDDPLFARLESEARELTEIGNRFMMSRAD